MRGARNFSGASRKEIARTVPGHTKENRERDELSRLMHWFPRGAERW
jgi:hypothetical protein